jgi:hypothetical protein
VPLPLTCLELPSLLFLGDLVGEILVPLASLRVLEFEGGLADGAERALNWLTGG